MFVENKYQLLPPLSEIEFESLKLDIKAHGVLIPIVFDEDGNILDGHHRYNICKDLGITDYPRMTKRNLTELEKRSFARTTNIHRRHLTRSQRRGLIVDELTENPSLPNLQIAKSLGVSDHTVAKMRKQLGLQDVKVLGADGKEYTTTHRDQMTERYVYSMAFPDEIAYKKWTDLVRKGKKTHTESLISEIVTASLEAYLDDNRSSV